MRAKFYTRMRNIQKTKQQKRVKTGSIVLILEIIIIIIIIDKITEPVHWITPVGDFSTKCMTRVEIVWIEFDAE